MMSDPEGLTPADGPRLRCRTLRVRRRCSNVVFVLLGFGTNLDRSSYGVRPGGSDTRGWSSFAVRDHVSANTETVKMVPNPSRTNTTFGAMI